MEMLFFQSSSNIFFTLIFLPALFKCLISRTSNRVYASSPVTTNCCLNCCANTNNC
uniref:Candidate secreted effector n=1 Tax=Meloidogyne incognita TaxID=6306 RepID=A0A914LM53_MELIC